MSNVTIPSIVLNTGAKMPVLGLGTWKIPAEEAGGAVKAALTEAGYVSLDCAWAYFNEKEIGQTLKEVFAEGKLKRENLFITSKLWTSFHRPDCVRQGCEETLANLQLDYLDLFLIHFPTAMVKEGEGDSVTYVPAATEDDYLDTWKEMEKLVDAGLVRAIGISNFNSKQTQRVLDNCRIKPAVHQFESHVFCNNQPLIDFCKERDIVITAYSPFGSPDRPWASDTDPRPLLEPTVKAIADRHGKTPAQVLLRHAVQRGLVVIPKTTHLNRMKENIQIFDFELTAEDMFALQSLNKNFRACPGLPSWKTAKDYPWAEGGDSF